MSGPQEGTYFIHPNHIYIRLPKDSEDEDMVLVGGKETVAGPQPTGVTFLLARIGLARLCREYTDTVPLETSNLLRVPYDHIIALDQKLKDYLTELPYFFQFDGENRQKSKHIEVIYTNIPMMRYCILAAVHSRRCRLHQKFLIRKPSDPRYTYSRQACLESARAVVQLYGGSRGEGDSASMDMARMAMVVHYTHLALVILVMDLCFNKDEADHEERQREVISAFQMLEGARSLSPLLNRSLDSVIDVLHKHGVYLLEEDLIMSHNVGRNAQQTHEGNSDAFNDIGGNFLQQDLHSEKGTLELDSSMNEFWQNAGQLDVNFDSAAWDTLFSGLDSRPF
jgi:hypothetical protein